MIVILNVTLDASWWLIFHFTSSKMQLSLGDQRLWASSCWFLALKWSPNSALICVFKKYHIYTYKQLFLFSVSSWRRAIILRDDDMYTWSYLLNVRTSTYQFEVQPKETSRKTHHENNICRQILQRYLTDPNSSTYPLAVPPRSWVAQLGEWIWRDPSSFGKCVTFVKTCFLCVLLMYYIFQFLSILFASVYVIGFS